MASSIHIHLSEHGSVFPLGLCKGKNKTLQTVTNKQTKYEGHSVNSEIRYVNAIACL